jgi:tRNA A37 threonylcarbamoyladenosine dehydratase
VDLKFDRSKILFGEDFQKIQSTRVLLIGVGGVGGYCLDCLCRSGLSDITIVDFDTFEASNQNRQIGSEALGAIKVEHLKTLYPSIKTINTKVTPSWCEEFDFESFDLIIDAIDDMSAKVSIANNAGDKLISSMGGAKRIDPTQIEIGSIWKTHGEGLAKKFRYELRKSGFKGDFEVVFSPEKSKCEGMGSFVGVTGSFGLTLCSLAIRKILS